MACITSLKYTMYADVYEPTQTFDDYTNSVKVEYVFKETVPCLVRSIITTSTGSNSANFVTAKTLNYPENTLKMRTKKPLDVTLIVTGIRNLSGEYIWKENQYGRQNGTGVDGATIFEPRGSSPIVDHNGNIIEYEVMLERQETQSVEIDNG